MPPKRTYRACSACRSRKVRCDVGNSDQPRFPCLRCRRMGKTCIPGNLTAAFNNETVGHDRTLPQINTESHRRQSEDMTYHSSKNSLNATHMVESGLFIREPVDSSTDAVNALLRAAKTPHPRSREIQTPNPYEAWSQCWLVRKKWIRAEEAVCYVGEFFKNLAPMTPIISSYFSEPKNHNLLIVYEPILCYTILSISSMFHSPPSHSSSLGSDLIHVKCWSIVKRLCNCVFWAEEHGSASKLRTYGTVLALLLLVEWPPIIPNLPQDDMCDFVVEDVISTSSSDATHANLEDLERHIRVENAAQSIANLSEPIIRSDRMSIMLIGMAHSLYDELTNASSPRRESPHSSTPRNSKFEQRYLSRKIRACSLLYIYNAQSSISSCSPTIHHRDQLKTPQADLQATVDGARDEELVWRGLISSWTVLSEIGADFQEALLGARKTHHETFLERQKIFLSRKFMSRLELWRRETNLPSSVSPIRNIIEVEYQHLCMKFTSSAVQLISRLISENGILPTGGYSIEDYSDDQASSEEPRREIDIHDMVKQGVRSSRCLLTAVIELGNEGLLATAPLRIFTRIIFAATFLLKAACILSDPDEVADSLALIESTKDKLEMTTKTNKHTASNTSQILSFHIAHLCRLFPGSRRDDENNGDNGGLGFIISNNQEDRDMDPPNSPLNPSDSGWENSHNDGIDLQNDWLSEFESLWCNILSGGAPVIEPYDGCLEFDSDVYRPV